MRSIKSVLGNLLIVVGVLMVVASFLSWYFLGFAWFIGLLIGGIFVVSLGQYIRRYSQGNLLIFIGVLMVAVSLFALFLEGPFSFIAAFVAGILIGSLGGYIRRKNLN